MQANIENLDLKLDIRDKINAGWALVNANTALIASTGQRFATIQAAITAATAPATIIVFPGTYDEQLTLKTGVDLHFMHGAVLHYTSGTAGPAILDNEANVLCRILGHGRFLRTGSGGESPVLHLRGQETEVLLEGILASAISATGAIMMGRGPHLIARIDVEGHGTYACVNVDLFGGTRDPFIDFRGKVSGSGGTYGFVLNNAEARIDAHIRTPNSAINVTDSTPFQRVFFTGHAQSIDLFGLESSGGEGVILLRNAIMESLKADATDGSAISKYGGSDELWLDNVILLCTHADAKSIESQGNASHGAIKVLTSSYANRAVQVTPAINFTYGETLLGIDT